MEEENPNNQNKKRFINKGGADPVRIGQARKAFRAIRDVNKVSEVIKTPSTTSRKVTDLNYYMDGYLRQNLDEVPKFLKKSWDCVIIVSGNAKVRIGKSTLALQVARYLAYLLNEQRKKKGLVPKDTKVPFDNTHVVFSPDEVMKVAGSLPKNSVIVYDEGRAGLDSARAMENINKTMQDFFQECGQYGHVIIVVLPDFFKLNETIAIPRSLFLLNCYTNKNFDRGYFSFFSEHRKELLYIFGKKRWGSTSKYMAVPDNFHGRFTNFFPIDRDLYDNQKKEALKKRKKTQREVRWHIERDTAFYLLEKHLGMTDSEMAIELSKYLDNKITDSVIKHALEATRRRIKKEYYEE